MSKYIDADQIRAEIERRLKRENEILWNAKKRGTYPSPSCEYNLLTLTSLLAFLDTLPEQPMEGLEEEISRTYHDGSVADTDDMDHIAYENIARHFAEWGAEHLKR